MSTQCLLNIKYCYILGKGILADEKRILADKIILLVDIYANRQYSRHLLSNIHAADGRNQL